MNATTIYDIRTRLLLLLLLLTMTASRAWAVDDTFMVEKNTTGADITYATGTKISDQSYSSLTLGFSDQGSFKIENDKDRLSGNGNNPGFDGSGVPNSGTVYVFEAKTAGTFVFTVDLNSGMTIRLRNGSGNDIASKYNSTGEKWVKGTWAVTVEEIGTYYLFAYGSKLEIYGYTFTRKPIRGITELPYFADFSSDTEPFEGGTSKATTNVGQVFSVNNSTATALFNSTYVPKRQETVTIAFTAYHGYFNQNKQSTISVRNSSGQSLVSYTYNQNSTQVTDVSFGNETAAGFEPFIGVGKYSANQSANGFIGNGKPYIVGSGTNNPLITMTICGNGKVTFSFVCSNQSIERSYSTVLDGMQMDLASIVIEDNNTNDDRAIGIDDLRITSELYSSDYENTGGMTDWTTSTAGRYTPIIMEDGSNHYMGVNQDQRYNNGATLTNNSVSGSAVAGEDFTLTFDMKLGRSDRNQTPTKFTVFDATNATELFSLADQGSTDNTWVLAVAGAASENITLAGTTNASLAALTWYHYKLSYTDGKLYVTITSQDGNTAYLRKCYTTSSTGGLGKLTFATMRYYANFAFDNLKVSAYANTNFTVKGKAETFYITSTGDLKQVEEGSTITVEFGTEYEGQTTKTNAGHIGAYCIDKSTTGFYTRAWCPNPIATSAPDVGTFYKFTPKYNGKLTIQGGVEDANGGALNNVTLRTADGSVRSTIVGTAAMYHTFDIDLVADTDYYLFAETEGTGNWDSSKGAWATFFLSGFVFTQASMNREVKVSDLLYVNGKTQSDGLDRTIPGFNLTFTGGSAVSVTGDAQKLTIADGGSMTIALRQNGYSANITSITLMVSDASSATVNGESITSAGKKVLTISPSASSVSSVTLNCTAGSFSITSFVVGYSGDDENNTATWLDEEKTMTPTLSFATTHIMRVPADGQAFANSAPSVSSINSFRAPLTYATNNASIATIAVDGTGGQLLRSGEATIIATFAETDYFNSAQASYTVSNVLQNGETYTTTAAVNDIVRIDASAAVAGTTLTLTGTTDASLTYGTTVEKQRTTANSTTITLTNNTANDITISTLKTFAKNAVAFLYYDGQEENYALQAHFQNFASGAIKGFRVLDIGDVTDPIELTDAYSLKAGAVYTKTEGSHVKDSHFGDTFNNTNGSFTISGKNTIGEEEIETLPVISHLLTKTGSAEGYPDELTAIANIFVCVPSGDTFKTWDFTSSVSGNGQMESRWTWDAHGYYQTYMQDYLPILNNSSTTLAGNEGLLVSGDMRYYVGANGLRLNLTRCNGKIKFPVKKGMEVAVEVASASADVTNIITNALEVTGEKTKVLYVEKQGVLSPVTCYYLAEEDGCMEIHAMDKMGTYLKSITLQKPKIHFKEEIVTVKSAAEAFDITNIPYNTGTATLTYSIETGQNHDLNDGALADGIVATVSDATNGVINVKGSNQEGWVTVTVTNPGATGVEPAQGTYKLYVVDFRFNPSYNDNGSGDPSLNLDEAANGEVVFSRRPLGYDKVKTSITYSIETIGSARGRLTQTTGATPAATTYQLTAYSAGTIYVKATTGRITTRCELTITGQQFADIVPARSYDELSQESSKYVFKNQVPSNFETGATTITAIDRSGSVTVEKHFVKLTGLTGYGALRVTAANDNGTGGDTSDDKIAQFVLTIPYPASTGHKWDFYRYNNGLQIGEIGVYSGEALQTVEDKTITGSNGWTTTGTNWTKVYRKGNEQPRWAYTYSMKRDNAFIIEETAGLQIETGQQGFYTDNPASGNTIAYNHIGLHNNASVIIPRLKKGDFVSLNLSRVIPNNGAIIALSNVRDLAGVLVDKEFTITRSQTDYNENGSYVDGEGKRIIPGYYTFQVAEDGDVTLTLADEGYLDILSIEIYNNEYATPVGATRDTNGYLHTMTSIVTDNDYVAPITSVLKDNDEQLEIDFAICHYMKSTAVGPADYVLLSKNSNLNATLENVDWYSDGGATYVKGKLSVGSGFGNVTVRMNNYTAEGKYLIGYTPEYTLTVGRAPHQTYPYTWNFTNISGGAVKDKSDNAYNSVSTDYNTWANLGNYRFGLYTDTGNGSLYVPGATLVSKDRELSSDEFAGLGFSGGLYFQTAAGTADVDPVIVIDGSGDYTLLEYTLTSSNYQDAAIAEGNSNAGYWAADNGFVQFGSKGKRDISTVAASGAAYQMDGGGSKHILLKPQRPFRNGDVITFKGYYTAAAASTGSNYGMSFRNEASQSVPYLAATFIPAGTANNTEVTLTYTVTQGDGIAGLSEVYVFRANTTTFLTYVKVTTTDDSAGASYGKCITASSSEPLVITIPDLNADSKHDWIYIESSAAPTSITNATAAEAEDGQDAKAGVYKYKVTEAGNCDVTFAANTTISRIGVTHIMKQLTTVGEGESAKAWATESRDRAIDYSQTGVFTQNDVAAKYATVSYDVQKATVTLNDVGSNGVPASTGLVLRLDNTTNLLHANSNGVPLFAPAISTNVLTAGNIQFNGSMGNMMRPNLEARLFTTECENANATDNASGVYTRYILATKYMKWKKVNNQVSNEATFATGTVPVFYRLHIYSTTIEGDGGGTPMQLNTLGENKAYLSLRTANLPNPLWQGQTPAVARRYIGIMGISDMEEEDEFNGDGVMSGATGIYNLNGQKVADDDSQPLPPGVYIRNGKKIIMK